MPKPTNDEIVRRHAQLRNTLIDKHALIAAKKSNKLKKASITPIRLATD